MRRNIQLFQIYWKNWIIIVKRVWFFNSMIQNGSIRVFPDEIIFKDINLDESDKMDFWIHNIWTNSCRLHFVLPSNPYFILTSSNYGLTAPGLELKSTIKCISKPSTPFSINLQIQSPNGSLELPIKYIQPTPLFKFSTNHIDLGRFSLKNTSSSSFTIGNFGDQTSEWSLKCFNTHCSFEPSSGELAPSQTVNISVCYKPESSGKFSFNVSLVQFPDVSLKVSGVVLESPFDAFFQGNQIKELDFGIIYQGQKKIFEIEVVNKTNLSRSFLIHQPKEIKDFTKPTRLTQHVRMPTVQNPNFIFSITPCEGVLKPNGKMNINVIFCPNESDPQLNTTQTIYTHITAIQDISSGELLPIQLTGVSTRPNIHLSSIEFDFGKQKLKETASLPLIIENRSTQLPINFEIKKPSQFQILPNSGSINPLESMQIEVVFCPKNLGEFHMHTNLVVCDGLDKFRLNLNGTGVASTINSNNVVSRTVKMDQNDEIRYKRPEIWEINQEADINSNFPPNKDSMTKDEIRRKALKEEEFHKYITDPAEKRAAFNQKKAKYLKAKQDITKKFEAEKKEYTKEDIKFYAKKMVNIDIDDTFRDHEGLEPPEPYIPGTSHSSHKSDDPFSFGLNQNSSNSKKIIKSTPFNDRILIQHKFKAKPTTPPERNECIRELTPIQLTSIIASHQVINFGDVAIFSTEKRSFQISNTLDQHILVSIETNCPELSKTTPKTQVIPPQQIAGFDITLQCNHVQKFNKMVQYTINGQHQFAFNVSAKIIPVDVILSDSVLEFKFPDLTEKPIIKKALTLTNNSNNMAEYKWNGFNQYFSISNDYGQISPRSSVTVNIFYSPKTQKRSEAIVEMVVTGGATKQLKLIGDTGFTQVVSKASTLDVG